MAKQYIAQMLENGDNKHYTIMGWSLGGIIAFEMAQQLKNYSIENKFKLILYRSS